MKILCIEAELGRDDLPAFTVVSGNVHIEIEVLKPRLKRWHWWDDSRPYHGVFARTLMVPVLSVHAEWWRQDKVPLTDRLAGFEEFLSNMLTDRSGYFGMILTKFTTPEEVFGPVSLEELKNDGYHQ